MDHPLHQYPRVNRILTDPIAIQSTMCLPPVVDLEAWILSWFLKQALLSSETTFFFF